MSDSAERCGVCPQGASSFGGKDRCYTNTHTCFLRIIGYCELYDKGKDLILPWGRGWAISPYPRDRELLCKGTACARTQGIKEWASSRN